VTIINTKGEIVKSLQIKPLNGSSFREINIENLDTGVFLLKITNSSVVKVVKFIKN
jgi:hypothetical protein